MDGSKRVFVCERSSAISFMCSFNGSFPDAKRKVKNSLYEGVSGFMFTRVTCFPHRSGKSISCICIASKIQQYASIVILHLMMAIIYWLHYPGIPASISGQASMGKNIAFCRYFETVYPSSTQPESNGNVLNVLLFWKASGRPECWFMSLMWRQFI